MVAAILLYSFANAIKVWIPGVLYLVGWAIIIFVALQRNHRNRQKKKAINRDFNPISLGTLYFSFAIPLWTFWVSEQKSGQPTIDVPTFLIAIIASVISFIFFVSVFGSAYSRRILNFMNMKAAPALIFLTFIAFLYGFVLGWLPALQQLSDILREIIMFFGFAWIVVILLRMIEETGNDLVNILLIVVLMVLAIIRIIKLDPVNIIGGVTLFIIAGLAYMVTTRRLRLYGEVFEQ